MKKINKRREILTYVLLGLLLIPCIIYIISQFILDENYKEIVNTVCITLIGLILFVMIIMIFIEDIYNKKLDKNINIAIESKEYSKGLDYVTKLRIPSVFAFSIQRKMYYQALLSLYLEDKMKAKEIFNNMDLFSSNINPIIYVTSVLYLMILSLENNEEEIIKQKFLAKKINVNKNNIKPYNVLMDICNNNLSSLKTITTNVPCIDLIISKL